MPRGANENDSHLNVATQHKLISMLRCNMAQKMLGITILAQSYPQDIHNPWKLSTKLSTWKSWHEKCLYKIRAMLQCSKARLKKSRL